MLHDISRNGHNFDCNGSDILSALMCIRDHTNIVFIGHVDAGKSTLAGQILLLTVSLSPASLSTINSSNLFTCCEQHHLLQLSGFTLVLISYLLSIGRRIRELQVGVYLHFYLYAYLDYHWSSRHSLPSGHNSRR
jgi:Elongation factor Tu GTP binding domain